MCLESCQRSDPPFPIRNVRCTPFITRLEEEPRCIISHFLTHLIFPLTYFLSICGCQNRAPARATSMLRLGSMQRHHIVHGRNRRMPIVLRWLPHGLRSDDHRRPSASASPARHPAQLWRHEESCRRRPWSNPQYLLLSLHPRP